MTTYYNEFDPKAASWLRQLITNGDIAPGIVDERSITEVHPDDLKGFERVHFFAGIGTWDYCLTNAGFTGNVWTASLPCQPFSAAGNKRGKEDERHLLPHFLELVRECRPDLIFGEQVDAAVRHGWLDDLYTEMEAENYTVGSAILGAHSVNSAHIRKRIYWVAHSESVGWKERPDQRGAERERGEGIETGREVRTEPGDSGASSIGMAHSINEGSQRGVSRGENQGRENINRHTGCGSTDNRMVDTISSKYRCQKRGLDEETSGAEVSDRTEIIESGELSGASEHVHESIDWLYCRDQKYRPIKSGIKPLVDGIARGMVYSSDTVITPNASAEARTIRLKGYGNAIVAPVATEFIRATMEVIDEKMHKM